MHIINVAAEMAPLIKVGGLSDVTCGLSRELSKNNTVEVILPKYRNIHEDYLKDLKIISKDVITLENKKKYKNTIWQANYDKIRITLIDPEHELNYFGRDNVYGYKDDLYRFLYFSRTVFEYLTKHHDSFDILHIHDWHTAILSVLFHEYNQKKPNVVLTIHNLQYQGRCHERHLNSIGLDGKKYLDNGSMQDNKYKHSLNLLKGGIVYSDAITTVSPSYAKEILHKKNGENLDITLIQNKNKLHGILNGIDQNIWNPETDKFLKVNYSSKDSLEKILKAKKENKKHLRSKLDLEDKHAPVISNIGRLVPQKGPSLIRHAILRTIEKNSQFVLLGSSPNKMTERRFNNLREKLHSNKDIHMYFGHSEELAHLLYAASDFIIVPSFFEPCGLTQIIAMRYGTIPIVRRTGGLADTISDIDNPILQTKASDGYDLTPNGYTFDAFSQKGINNALDRAIKAWFDDPQKIHHIKKTIMNIDYSWKKSAEKYVELYKGLIRQD